MTVVLQYKQENLIAQTQILLAVVQQQRQQAEIIQAHLRQLKLLIILGFIQIPLQRVIHILLNLVIFNLSKELLLLHTKHMVCMTMLIMAIM